MTTHETTTSLSRSLHLEHPARIALFVLVIGQLLAVRVHGAEKAADPYDTLHDVLMTRYAKDGKSHAENESSPVILPGSNFPFGDKTYQRLNAALDAFGALSQAEIEAYSDIKRALLQRHLWKVFDAAYPYSWRLLKDRRVAVQPKIASLIHSLALTRQQILALPDTRAATIKSGGFAECHDPKDQFKPFLPADLYSKESSWICLAEGNHPIPADQHTFKLISRSAFLQFIRLPGGRIETLNYIEKLNRKEVFPVGTQFALIEQAFLISDYGELILSPLIVSIQLRAYLDVTRHAKVKVRGRLEPTQCVAEFVMQPRQLMRGNAVMKATGPSDFRFEAGQEDSQDFSPLDPFERGKMPTITRLNLCVNCHGGTGGHSLGTTSFNPKSSPRLFFEEGSPEAISKATSAQKRDDATWKSLRELCRAEFAPARAGQPQPPPDNKGKPGERRPAKPQ